MDSALRPVVFPEGFVVDEDVDHISWARRQPAGVLLGGQRPLLPPRGGEAEPDVIRDPVVAEQHPNVRSRRLVDVVGASPPYDAFNTFGDHGSVSHRIQRLGDSVVVDALGVLRDPWLVVEQVLHQLAVHANLFHELGAIGSEEAGEGVVVRLLKKLHAARPRKLPEGLQ